MEKIKNFVSKNALMIVGVLLLVMFMQTCNKNGKIKRLTKRNTQLEVSIDSLDNLVMSPEQKKTIEWSYGIIVYTFISDEITKLDRTAQMKSLQQDIIIKNRTILTDSIATLKTK